MCEVVMLGYYFDFVDDFVCVCSFKFCFNISIVLFMGTFLYRLVISSGPNVEFQGICLSFMLFKCYFLMMFLCCILLLIVLGFQCVLLLCVLGLICSLLNDMMGMFSLCILRRAFKVDAAGLICSRSGFVLNCMFNVKS